MPISARHGVAGLAIAAVLAIAACTDPAPPPAATTATTPTTASPTSPTTPTSAADPQLAGAEATVAKLWNLVDVLGADPKRSLDELNSVARDQSLETWRDLLTNQRRHGYKQPGESRSSRRPRRRVLASLSSTPAWTSARPTS